MALDFPSSPTSGQIYDRYKWDSTDTVWSLNLPEYNLVPLGYLPSIQYVVISGGAGGGANIGGGGGAGAYRSSVVGESSGGAVNAELPLGYTPGTYQITVGAGGAGAAPNNTGSSGGSSSISAVSVLGGGGGGNYSRPGGAGGSGVVIIKYPADVSLTIGAGLESETDSVSVPGYKITTFTAGSDTIEVI